MQHQANLAVPTVALIILVRKSNAALVTGVATYEARHKKEDRCTAPTMPYTNNHNEISIDPMCG